MKIYTLLLVSALLFFFNCGKNRDDRSDSNEHITATIKVLEITHNDLAQVLLFARDKNDRVIIFKKDFFSRDKKKKNISTEIDDYINQLQQYKGHIVLIEYNENNSGDKIISSIELIESVETR